MKNIKSAFIWAALILAAVIGVLRHDIITPLAFLVLAAFINSSFTAPRGSLRITLSVPELSMLIFDAFKTLTPELFGEGGFAIDVSSKTAVLGDVITSHIGAVPTSADYDQVTGFENGIQDVTGLAQDVPVTLAYFKHVPIRIKWLSQLSSKIDLTRFVMNQGYALRKLIIDTALAQVTAANFSHQYATDPANVSLDSVEYIRGKLNGQKASPFGRFGIVNTKVAGALQADQRVGSSLFYNQLNGDNPIRHYKNLAGFKNVYEYPDYPAAGNGQGYFGDSRGVVIASRGVDYSNAADLLRVPKVVETVPMQDDETGFPFTAVGYQKYGTGDVTFSLAVLFGIGAGNQGGAADTKTDPAGVRFVTQGNET